ncbi:MAG: hypothetical protein RL685_2642 [Pseudomonadota bacterium]|jgi:SAM-dependent methyltransferase
MPTSGIAMTSEKMLQRSRCITCGSPRLEPLSSGHYRDAPLHDFVAADPWGESPLPYLKDEVWRFVSCRDCSMMFHQQILTPTWQERLYRDWVTDTAMREFEERHGISTPTIKWSNGRECVRHLLRVEKLTRELRGTEPLRVIDFGCGWGQFLAAAAVFGAEAYGVDRDADRLQQAGSAGVTVAPTLADLPRSLRGKADAVSLFQVLEHLEEPKPVLEELHGWLRPGGILILEVPDCTGVKGFNSEADYRAINPLAHINAFTPHTLKEIARRAGYEPIDYVPAHVTAELFPVAKSALKGLLPALERKLRPSTEQYFRRAE